MDLTSCPRPFPLVPGLRLRDIISTVNSSHVYLVLECLDCDLRFFLDNHAEAHDLRTVKASA